MNPKQFEKHVENYVDTEKERAKELDTNNFLLGRYMLYAYNDPKHYPAKPFLVEAEERKKAEKTVMTDEDMAKQMKRNFILFSGMRKTKKHGSNN